MQNNQKNSRLAFTEAATTQETKKLTKPILQSVHPESQKENTASSKTVAILNRQREVSFFPDKIPMEMKQHNQWILWRLVTLADKGKTTKMPYALNGTRADTTNPNHYSSFAEALRVYESDPRNYDGLGYVFSANDPFTGIDIDNCIVDGKLTDEADEIINALDSYSERSQSGTGVHVIVKARLQSEGNRTGSFEIYDRKRYFAITGDHLGLTPKTIDERQQEVDELCIQKFANDKPSTKSPQKGSDVHAGASTLSDQDIIGIAVKAKNGSKFAALYSGDWIDYYGSQSEADQALCNILAFYTKDSEQIDRLFRGSGLMREKWERDDYQVRTISQALNIVTAQYATKGKPNSEESTEDDLELLLVPKSEWNVSLSPDALHGLAWDVVQLILPHSEADPAALLINFLTIFGNTVGTWPHFTVTGGEHRMKLFAVLVGATFKGKKGTSLDPILKIMGAVDSELSKRKKSGLSSGEGVIHAVRDQVTEMQPIMEGSGKNRKPTGAYEEVVVDYGVDDKRLLVVEGEFGGVLNVLRRDGNTLGAIIRNAWDGQGDIQTMTKKPVTATNTHLSILGHITPEELRKLVTDNEIYNGFVNRFLWFYVQQSKSLPSGGEFHKVDTTPIVQRIQEAVEFSLGDYMGERKPMERDAAANSLWESIYESLQRDAHGIIGAAISRGTPYVMRIACIYALLDLSWTVRIEHLKAALAVWEYCRKSVHFIFGENHNQFDPISARILAALKERSMGLTSTQISVEIFKKNQKAADIATAIEKLRELGLITVEKRPNPKGKGKPITVVRLLE
ncbi:Protein of unknown function [Paenibacillus sp. 1_12]|uniref:phage NrS-1 polymerase family protein n=1 Tax=Paenibacillus sp. 1_12 TaxID=1566278 RepID=UPI0008EDF39E|nr:DUF3987 domain-containing protein [Paenibacillus sp. 1_12]SFM12233.1 Protein of unknown function [Paenibacillus sp. 1_12]